MAEGTTTMSGHGTNASPAVGAPRRPIAARLSALPGKVLRRLQRYYRRWFQNRNHVFVHRGPFDLCRPPVCDIAKYTCFADVPEHVRQTIIMRGGEKVLDTDRSELNKSAIVWVGFMNGVPAGMLFGRHGQHFKKWFVPLSENDLVLYRGRTYEDFRGKGVMPSLITHAMNESLQHGDSAFCDCAVYNNASRRCIEKAGFTHIATMKPISRQDAFGE